MRACVARLPPSHRRPGEPPGPISRCRPVALGARRPSQPEPPAAMAGYRQGDGRGLRRALCLQGADPTRSVILTRFWHCGDWQFSFRRLLRSGRWQPSVNRFGRRFRGSKGSGNADSQPNDRNRREGGVGRTSRHDSGCVPAHPPSWAPSYLPLRADWARAPGHSGVSRTKGPFSAPGKQREPPKRNF